MTDDPLFDPWWIAPQSEVEPDADAAPPAAARFEPDPAAPPEESEPTGPSPKWRSPAVAPGAPMVRVVRSTTPAVTPVAVKSKPSVRKKRYSVDLRTLIVPPLADVRQRLEIAGHETTIDDRLDEAEPSIRFRVQPHAGPFDEPATVGSVLEVRLETQPGPKVVGRLWMDPRAAGPGEEREVDAHELSRDWVDALLLDFLVKTLRLA